MSYERKKFHLLSISFLHKKTSMKKNLTVYLGQSVPYETLVQFTKPWTLYSVSVLRYRGSKVKNNRKVRFFKTFLQKDPWSQIFFDFFGKNVAWDPAQLLGKTWYPYLFSVLRNLPHKFEMLADVTNLRKKRHRMGTSQSSSPKNFRQNVQLIEMDVLDT